MVVLEKVKVSVRTVKVVLNQYHIVIQKLWCRVWLYALKFLILLKLVVNVNFVIIPVTVVSNLMMKRSVKIVIVIELDILLHRLVKNV